jgi:hypothetical protein
MFASGFARRHGTIALGLLGVVAIGSFFALPMRSHADAQATAPAQQLTGLQQERIDTLRQASDLTHQMFESGLTTAEETFRVDRLLTDAQLEVAASVQDRTKVLRNALEVARKQEDLASRQHKAGVVGPLGPLEAKAERLRLEIELSKLTAK